MSMHELISDSQRLWFRPEWLLEDDDSDQNHDNDNGFHRAVICLWIWKMEGRDLQQQKKRKHHHAIAGVDVEYTLAECAV